MINFRHQFWLRAKLKAFRTPYRNHSPNYKRANSVSRLEFDGIWLHWRAMAATTAADPMRRERLRPLTWAGTASLMAC